MGQLGPTDHTVRSSLVKGARARQGRAGQGRAGQGSAGQGRAGQGRAEQSWHYDVMTSYAKNSDKALSQQLLQVHECMQFRECTSSGTSVH